MLAGLPILVGLIWITFPVSVPALLAWQLKGIGWQLHDLDVKRPTTSNLVISHLQLNDIEGNYAVSAENLVMYFDGMDMSNLVLQIDRLALSISPSKTGGADESIDLPALLDTYLSGIPLPVQQGRIKQLAICFAPAECQAGSLEWSASNQVARLSVQTDELQLAVDLADQFARLSLKGNQDTPVDGTLEIRWPGRTDIEMKGSFSFDLATVRHLLASDLDQQLPHATGSAVVEADLTIPLLHFESAAAMAQQVSGDMLLDTTGTIQWRDQDFSLDALSPLSLSISLQSGIARMKTRQAYPVKAAILGTGSASFAVPADLVCSTDLAATHFGCTASELEISARLDQPQLTTELHIRNAKFDLNATGNPEPGIPTAYQITGQFSLAASGSMSLEDEEAKLAFSKPMAISVSLQSDLLQVNTLEPFAFSASLGEKASGLVSSTGPAQCQLDLAAANSSCSLVNLSIAATIPENQLTAAINLKDTVLSADAKNSLDLSTELNLQMMESGNQRVAMTGKLTLEDNRVNLSSNNLTLDQLLFRQFDAHHDLTSQSGGFTLNFQSQANVLDQWTGFPVRGQLVLSQQLEWQGPFDTDWQQWQVKTLTKVDASKLSTEVDGSIFEGGAFEAGFAGWPNLQTIAPAHLTWKTIDVGFPVKHAVMDFHMDINPVAESFRINGVFAQAELFGGKVSSDSFSYDYPSDQGRFLANLELLDLGQILLLVEQDLHSSGQLVGNIPVTYDKGHLSVDTGHVESIAPGGFIQYRTNESAASLASGNAQMALVMKMLQNFRYDFLKSDVDYSNRSILKLKTTLSGRNPEIEGGRQINFNLNIEEDIAALLESLRLSREVSDGIDKNFADPTKRTKKPQSGKPREANNGKKND